MPNSRQPARRTTRLRGRRGPTARRRGAYGTERTRRAPAGWAGRGRRRRRRRSLLTAPSPSSRCPFLPDFTRSPTLCVGSPPSNASQAPVWRAPPCSPGSTGCLHSRRDANLPLPPRPPQLSLPGRRVNASQSAFHVNKVYAASRERRKDAGGLPARASRRAGGVATQARELGRGLLWRPAFRDLIIIWKSAESGRRYPHTSSGSQRTFFSRSLFSFRRRCTSSSPCSLTEVTESAIYQCVTSAREQSPLSVAAGGQVEGNWRENELLPLPKGGELLYEMPFPRKCRPHSRRWQACWLACCLPFSHS